MWESDLNVEFEMWSVFVFGLVCFPLGPSVRMNERPPLPLVSPLVVSCFLITSLW